MNAKYTIKGRILDKDEHPIAGTKVKAYDETGALIGQAGCDLEGNFLFECGGIPKTLRISKNRKNLQVVELADIHILDEIITLPVVVLPLKFPPAEWHITGVVTDVMSGEALPGLTVEVWDVDQSWPGTTTYYDSLGEDITGADGHFDTWFDGDVFTRVTTGVTEMYPDVLIKVKNSKGVLLHETPIDSNVSSIHHCDSYFPHMGKEYNLKIDYVTALINQIGPVDASTIDGAGFTTYAGVKNRPFGGNTTIGGRIWGSMVDQWKLYDAIGFVDFGDARLASLKPTDSAPSGFTEIKAGTNQVWDGPIFKWPTSPLEGLHTVILVVWDTAGNEYHDTQHLFLHNKPITPAAVISSPAPGSTISKAAVPSLKVIGTACDDYFYYYILWWVGPTRTEAVQESLTFPDPGCDKEKVNEKLADWSTAWPTGPYCFWLDVIDRTILNDGANLREDLSFNTFTLAD